MSNIDFSDWSNQDINDTILEHVKQLEQQAKSIDELKARIGELEKVVEAAKKVMSLCVPEAATEDEFYKALNNLNQPDKG